MALSINLMEQTFISSGIPFSMLGVNYLSLSSALANGIYSWIVNPANFLLVGTSTGQGPGTGIVSGLLSYIPNDALFLSTLNGFGFNGPTAPLLSSSILSGLSIIINSQANYSGTVSGVWNGSDVSGVTISNSITLSSSLFLYFSSILGVGALTTTLSQGLGLAIATDLQSVIGNGFVTPTVPIDIYPLTGVSNSSII